MREGVGEVCAPPLVDGATGATAGLHHSCAVLRSGNVRCWGSNSQGQAAPYAGGDAAAVAAGESHTCALLRAGNVDCWGANADSQARDYRPPRKLLLP